MQVVIHSAGFNLTQALRHYAEQRIGTALGWSRHHVRRLTLSLADINGPRGGVDKRCTLHAVLACGREVVIKETRADLYAAIDQAAGRADRAVLRQLGRDRRFEHAKVALDLHPA